jgi:hypothetical protein
MSHDTKPMNESDGQPSAGPPGSANGVPDALRTKIKDLIRDAFNEGLSAETCDQIDFIDEFALADEALDEHWPNEKLTDSRRE